MYDAPARASIDLNAHFETRLLPLSTLAHGMASAHRKALNVAFLYQMETETDSDFDFLRKSVFGLTSDQGVEKSIGDASVRLLDNYADRYIANDNQNFLWPRSLLILGHLHLLYNCLEESCKGCFFSDEFFDMLKVITTCLNNSGLRDKFRVSCSGSDAFKHFPKQWG